MDTTTLTVRLSPALKERLGQLVERRGRTGSSLAAEAIADYVARELAIIEKINTGLEDMRAGRMVPHDEAMRQIRATIAEAREETALVRRCAERSSI